MKLCRSLAALIAVSGLLYTTSAQAADGKPPLKKLLLVTDSGGFIHDSVGLAEKLLKELGPAHGFEVTCYRFTRDPEQMTTITVPVENKGTGKVEKKQVKVKVMEEYGQRFRRSTGVEVTKESCGHVNAETLKNFDLVLFFTTGNPLNETEVNDLVAWVKAGGAVAGTHCGSDTLYPSKDRPWNAGYGELIGAYFDGHPWHKKIKVKVEDPQHPAGKSFATGDEITDEIYQFRPEPYSREKLHIIMSVDNSSIDLKKGKRKDNDYAISWCREVGKGRTFYTSLGHRKEVWSDKRYQEHLFGGLRWAVKLESGSAAPSAAAK